MGRTSQKWPPWLGTSSDLRPGHPRELPGRSSQRRIRGRHLGGGGDDLVQGSCDERSDQPYILPRAGHAFVLAGDDVGAEGTLERLRALGTRGRAVDADRASIAAGIAALRGDAAGALAGYRTAMAVWGSLGLPWDEALTTLEAATALARPARRSPAGSTARGHRSSVCRPPQVDRLDEAVAATPNSLRHRNDGGVAGLVQGRQLAGGAVLCGPRVPSRAHMRLLRRLAACHRDDHPRGRGRHVHERLADGRHRRSHPLRDRQVVEAHDAEVLGMWRRASRAAW